LTVLLCALAVLGCSQLTPDFDSVIAIEVAVPDSGFVELGDTVLPVARALNGRGEPISVPVAWGALDTAVVAVVDTETGAAWGKRVGTGRIQARVGNLRSNPVTIVVRPPLDSIKGDGDLRDTVTVSSTPRDTLSDSLRVRAFAERPATVTDAQNLVRRRITLELSVFPGTGSTVTLVPDDTVFTNTAGVAVLQVRWDAGTRPDSVLVTARSAHRDGTPVPGSPITSFVVEFRP
jgi:hypothetical protein